jgi:hypothetical protein
VIAGAKPARAGATISSTHRAGHEVPDGAPGDRLAGHRHRHPHRPTSAARLPILLVGTLFVLWAILLVEYLVRLVVTPTVAAISSGGGWSR